MVFLRWRTMDKKLRNKKILTVFAGILLTATYFMIFIFSADDAESSSNISLKVTNMLISIYHSLLGIGNQAPPDVVAVAAEGGIRKLAHFMEYMMLGFLSYGIAVMWIKSKWKGFLIVTIQMLLSGGLDEFHQYFVPGRNANVKDVLIDTAGGIAGMLVILGVKGIQRVWNHIRKRGSKTCS